MDPGYFLLFTGWLGILGVSIAWCANPIFLFGLWRTSKGKPTLAGPVAFAFGLMTFDLEKLTTGDIQSAPVTGYGIGFWLWLGAFVGLTLIVLPLDRLNELPRKLRHSLDWLKVPD